MGVRVVNRPSDIGKRENTDAPGDYNTGALKIENQTARGFDRQTPRQVVSRTAATHSAPYFPRPRTMTEKNHTVCALTNIIIFLDTA
jgi:hypothetical protein